jgi:hypothetical protein
MSAMELIYYTILLRGYLLMTYILIIGEGNFTKSDSGNFIHTGGWLFVHE